MLSKLQHALPKEHDHIFTFLNTNKERNKSFKEQLKTAKVMIQSHYKTNIVNTSKDNTMIFMLAGTNDTNNQTNDTYCDFCKKYGHPKMKNGKPYCFKYKKKLKKETKKDKTDDLDNINNMFVNCITTSEHNENTNKMAISWLNDTSAQCHIFTKSEKRSTLSKSSVKMGNNSTPDVLHCENITIADELGGQVCLKNTRVVNGVSTNIISLLQLVSEGWNMKIGIKETKNFIQITKDNTRLVFVEGPAKNLCYLHATVIETKLITHVKDNNTPTNKPSSIPKKPLKSWEINDFHDHSGHHGEEHLHFFANTLGYKLTGKLIECDACSLIKIKAKSIPKITSIKTLKVGERVGLDITEPFPITGEKHNVALKQKLYWYSMIDYYSGKTINAFCYTKTKIIDFVKESYAYMNTRKTPIMNLRMDNTGENLLVTKHCKTYFNINVEYTPPDTPKLNRKIERSFAIRWEKAKILMQNASLQDKFKQNQKILPRAIATAIFLTEVTPKKSRGLSSDDLFYGSNSKLYVKPEHYIQWGRVGFVANKCTHVSKMKARGTAMMFVGHALNDPSGTYEFYNPNVIVSNSVKWKHFSQWEPTAVDSAAGKLVSKQANPMVNLSDSDSNSDFDTPIHQTPLLSSSSSEHKNVVF